LFPPGDRDQNFKQSPAGRAHIRVTEEAVKRAIYSQSVKKALGPEKHSFGTRKLDRKRDKERTLRVTSTAMDMGRPTAIGNQIFAVVILKPGNHNYTKMMAYISVSLMAAWDSGLESGSGAAHRRS